jgi:double zinc ribbon protein
VDLERLFRQIVLNLAATDPARLRGPLPLVDICNSIVPYRANRRALQIESSEDYELALLRLCAGEGGLAYTEPGGTQLEFASEIASPNPDLTLLDRHPQALVHLSAAAVAQVTDVKSDLRFAPRQSALPDGPLIPSAETTSKPGRNGELTHCIRCSSALPGGRPLNFCPHCGYDLKRRQCNQCSSEIEPDWKHCVSCGVLVAATNAAAARSEEHASARNLLSVAKPRPSRNPR